MPPAARKSTAVTAKKTAAKKTAAKKTAAKKTTAKKTTAKKTTAKKAAPQTASTPYAGAQAAASAAASSAQAGVEDAVVRIRELQGLVLEAARRGGTIYLEAYEKNLSSMLELTESAAESTQLSWAVTLANNYADFVKRVNQAVMKAGRQALG
jgi:cell wall-associated NlpC family hydrolase